MKKRLLLYVLSTALLLAVFAGMAMPASAATGTLSVASVQAEPGDTITVDVSLVGAVAALQFDITYDPAVLTLVSIEKGSACPSGWTEATNITNGRFAVIGAIPLENVSINGAIARYTYTVNSGAALGESALELINIVISDEYSQRLDVTASNGSVTVLSGDPSSEPSTPSTPESTPSTPESTPSASESTPSTPESTPSTPESTPSTPDPSTPDDPSSVVGGGNGGNGNNNNNANTNNGAGTGKTGNPGTGDAGTWMYIVLFAAAALVVVATKLVVAKKQKS